MTDVVSERREASSEASQTRRARRERERTPAHAGTPSGDGPATYADDEPLLTADDVRDARFHTTRDVPGYDQREVDAFLELVQLTLTRLQAEREVRRTAPEPEPDVAPEPAAEADEAPTATEAAVHEEPVHEEPAHEEPAHEEPAHEEPADDATMILPAPVPVIDRVPTAFGHEPTAPSAPEVPALVDDDPVEPGAPAAHLTGDDVREARFPIVPGTLGYVVSDIDDFLDRLAASLDAVRHGGTPELDGRAVEAARFPTTWRGGYDQDAVDDLLERAVRTLDGA